MIGLAVKLAVCMRERDLMQEPVIALVNSCYEQVSKLTGTDPVAGLQGYGERTVPPPSTLPDTRVG